MAAHRPGHVGGAEGRCAVNINRYLDDQQRIARAKAYAERCRRNAYEVAALLALPAPRLRLGDCVRVPTMQGGWRTAWLSAPLRVVPQRGPDGRIRGRGVALAWVTGGRGPILAGLLVPVRDTHASRIGGVR